MLTSLLDGPLLSFFQMNKFSAIFSSTAWMYIGMIGGFLFILIQLILLIDLAHGWAENWIGKYEDTDNKAYYYGTKKSRIFFLWDFSSDNFFFLGWRRRGHHRPLLRCHPYRRSTAVCLLHRGKILQINQSIKVRYVYYTEVRFAKSINQSNSGMSITLR